MFLCNPTDINSLKSEERLLVEPGIITFGDEFIKVIAAYKERYNVSEQKMEFEDYPTFIAMPNRVPFFSFNERMVYIVESSQTGNVLTTEVTFRQRGKSQLPSNAET